ncbi:hypothetical protein D3C77_581600 [compost metagenome]
MKWISVDDEKPEPGERVLVYRPDASDWGDPEIRIAEYTGSHYGCYVQPSHWMRIPLKPEK